MKVKKLNKDAILPTRAHSTDAGLDLYAVEDVTIYPGETCKVSTGIAVAIPEGKVGRICPRSSLGSKGIDVFAGIVDCGYNGDVIVCLYNGNPGVISYDHDDVTGVRDVTYENMYHVAKGDRIAQLLIQDVCLCEVEEVDELDDTARGCGGFGSTN